MKSIIIVAAVIIALIAVPPTLFCIDSIINNVDFSQVDNSPLAYFSEDQPDRSLSTGRSNVDKSAADENIDSPKFKLHEIEIVGPFPFDEAKNRLPPVNPRFKPQIDVNVTFVIPLSRIKRDEFKHLSEKQKYVTPDDPEVQKIARRIKTPQEAYSLAVNWIWVSDMLLHGIMERWLMPHEFLAETPWDPDNPVPGYMVSDCEEQAYTLVSILEAIGVPKTDVRAVFGEVNFSGEKGGHAWVEIRMDDKWMQLDPTSGPYWDENTNKLVERKGYPYSYFLTHRYPFVEVYAYFNDYYYYTPLTGEGNAPSYWK